MSSPTAARERVIRIREQVEEYIREARRSIWSLRSPSLETGDLIDTLRHSAMRATSGHDVAFSFEQSGERRRLSSNVEHQLLRIGQEAVLNAVRHSEATTIDMFVHFDLDAVLLRITDNGRGFDLTRSTETTDHYGLTTMRERAEQAAGSLTIRSTVGGGTTVEATVQAKPATDETRNGFD